ncbi:RND family transporter [Parvibaculum sp.]|uniref:efflux RND transporter permease subunit n=1 Tax=Parvibaculum sp. TaxID=2024848 RepID=UPI0027301590|nr:efflux RND transporter permease subunit [Parvibaculum sp.]MDP1627380.1 efflux RND transporter permease subunit [Parvibaculum sp.]MDP2148559.1 efflux RND transporter permease subunit [Parvibaculum sp.]MDP3327516.1 efflux RND transporter permease subunit [Parvibaculum sp.]
MDSLLEWSIRRRKTILAFLALITLVMLFFALRVEVKTVFEDLLPTDHAYVQVNDKFKQDYGGSNVVSIMVEVDEGDILRPEILKKIKSITEQAALIPGADPFQVTSLATKKLKSITASTSGIETKPLMWPDLPANQKEIDELRQNIVNSPLTYGAYVAHDFKSALITVDFFDNLLDYRVFFDHITKIINEHKEPGFTIRVVGEPMLYGWVSYHLAETGLLFLGTIFGLFVALLLIARTWHGTIIPLISAGVSAIWAMGFAGMLGLTLDPLVVVIALLISAVAVSNSVQVIQKFDREQMTDPIGRDGKNAALLALKDLLRPASLGILIGGGCILVVARTPIPLLEMIAIVGGFWIFSQIVCAFLLPGLLASWTRGGVKAVHPLNLHPVLLSVLGVFSYLAISKWRYGVIGMAAVILIVSGYYAFGLKVGDANPGSPILHAESSFNRDAARLNAVFQGADRMFVVIDGKERDAIKQPEMLDTMERFMRYMEAQPEIGGSTSIVDILPSINRVLHEGNPRYEELGADAVVNGELAYLFISGSDPGDLQRYVAPDFSNASITLFFRDHQGDTIRNALERVERFIAENPLPNGGEYLLAGGLIGVLAAVNDVILAGQIQAIALALLVVTLLGTVIYRSFVAGTFLMIPIIISNTLTFSYMAYNDIGMTINTLPIVALGIGCGIDYTIFVLDAIRQQMRKYGDLKQAIAYALETAGMAVLITVFTLVVSVSLWSISSLRLQSEMALLISIWLSISAFAALIVIPALVYVIKPAFIVGKKEEPAAGTVFAAAE